MTERKRKTYDPFRCHFKHVAVKILGQGACRFPRTKYACCYFETLLIRVPTGHKIVFILTRWSCWRSRVIRLCYSTKIMFVLTGQGAIVIAYKKEGGVKIATEVMATAWAFLTSTLIPKTTEEDIINKKAKWLSNQLQMQVQRKLGDFLSPFFICSYHSIHQAFRVVVLIT